MALGASGLALGRCRDWLLLGSLDLCSHCLQNISCNHDNCLLGYCLITLLKDTQGRVHHILIGDVFRQFVGSAMMLSIAPAMSENFLAEHLQVPQCMAGCRMGEQV